MTIFPMTLTPAAAGQLAWRIRKLHRRGDLTHADLAIADALLWAARKPGSAAVVVSYSALCRLARVARSTVAAALTRLERLGVLSRIRRRVRVMWHQGASASRQDTSVYVLQAATDTEFEGRSVKVSVKLTSIVRSSDNSAAGAVAAARAALAERATAVSKMLANKGVGLAGAF